MSTVIMRNDTKQFLVSYDPTTDNVDWNPDRAKAYEYDTMDDALVGYNTQSEREPQLSDGTDNRPLTRVPVTFLSGGPAPAPAE